MNLTVQIHNAEEGGFWAEVEEIPGCITQGETIEELEANPLMRTYRVGKLTLLALEATLRCYRDGDEALSQIPAPAMLSAAGVADVRADVETLIRQGGLQVLGQDLSPGCEFLGRRGEHHERRYLSAGFVGVQIMSKCGFQRQQSQLAHAISPHQRVRLEPVDERTLADDQAALRSAQQFVPGKTDEVSPRQKRVPNERLTGQSAG